MSWSSGASSPGGIARAAGRRRPVESRSLVPYRESAMAYEPARFCGCNPPRKAPRWISWSHQNPGRRYFACVNAMHGGCGYAEWFDDPLPKFFSDLIGDLRDEVWKLRGEANVARTEVAPTEVAPAGLARPEDDNGRETLVMALQDELKRKNAEIAVANGNLKNVVFVFIVFVVGLVLGKVVMQ